MERPENIKKGLECFAQDRSYMLPCSDCDYHGQGKPHCRKAVHEDALALIEQLEREHDALLADFKLYRDRNINRTSGVYACDLCKHGGKYEEIEELTCPEGCNGVEHFQWRGVQEENNDENA